MERPEPISYDPRAYRMISDSQGVRLEPTGEPVVWVRKSAGAYRTVTDQHGIRLEPSGGALARILASLFFAGLAGMLLMTSLNLYAESDDLDDENLEGCERGEVQAKIGNNPLYCTNGLWMHTIESIEVSEDQHLRIKGESGGEYGTEIYRWEETDESLVYGYLYGDQYQCVRYIPEFNLPEDWVVEDLETSFEYPAWCYSTDEDQDTRVFEEGAHPYDDVWMYEAIDVEAMSFSLFTHKHTENVVSHQQYVAMGLAWGNDGDLILDNLLCFTLPLGLIFLLGVDQRRRVFVMDRKTKTVIRKRSGSIPTMFSKTWRNVDFSAMAVVRSVRQKTKTTQATEDAPARMYTKGHIGMNIVLKYGDEYVVLLFFEDGGDDSIHGQTIADFLSAMSSEIEADSIEPLPTNGTFERPTLQYLAEYNGVSEWNDRTALNIIAWYYESDPLFLEKYPEFNENPEFMLEDGGNRPLKEMYWRPLYAEAGLTTVASEEDAQRLLDYLMAQLGIEPTTGTQESTENEPRKVDAGAMGAFWSTDDAEEP